MNMSHWRKVKAFFTCIIIAGISTVVVAKNTKQTDQAFAQWLDTFRQDALKAGISEKTLNQALDGVTPYPKAIEKDRKQPEFTQTFQHYRDKRINNWAIALGKKNLQKHRALLRRIGKDYQVQPRYIIAFWALESSFGRFTGNNPVVRSLVTLAYDKRRGSYFRRELVNALRILDSKTVDLSEFKGSWSGAMGQPQFMPSSYLSYAVDYDKDGKKDIWHTHADVFASIANYLKSHGWDDSQTWGRPVKVPKSLLEQLKFKTKTSCRALKKSTTAKTIPQWQALGVRKLDGGALPTRALSSSIVFPDGLDGEAFLVYGNYQRILKYNCANHYALTIGYFSDVIWQK